MRLVIGDRGWRGRFLLTLQAKELEDLLVNLHFTVTEGVVYFDSWEKSWSRVLEVAGLGKQGEENVGTKLDFPFCSVLEPGPWMTLTTCRALLTLVNSRTTQLREPVVPLPVPSPGTDPQIMLNKWLLQMVDSGRSHFK